MNLRNVNVVVTGGSRGLGLGLVEALVSHGAKVTVVARSTNALESVRAQLGVATVCADVTVRRLRTGFFPRRDRTSWCSTRARNRRWGDWTS